MIDVRCQAELSFLYMLLALFAAVGNVALPMELQGVRRFNGTIIPT